MVYHHLRSYGRQVVVRQPHGRSVDSRGHSGVGDARGPAHMLQLCRAFRDPDIEHEQGRVMEPGIGKQLLQPKVGSGVQGAP